MIRLLPDSLKEQIAVHEAEGSTEDPAHLAAMEAYYVRHLRRQPERSPADADSARTMSASFVYQYRWGPIGYTSTGTLKRFDSTDALRNHIRAPALFLAGEFDEATPSSTEAFSRLVPNAEFASIPGAGHSTENDNPDPLFRTVRSFLQRAEGR
ncbi:MAG: hypothetical protein IT360_22580 [Gemmatimonadaceae bacterium]|nr:hypothetical protein [Gemmatimonadaceae bacterium]